MEHEASSEKFRPKTEKMLNSGLRRTDGSMRENKRKWTEQLVLRPYQKTKKLWNMKIMAIPFVTGALGRWKRWKLEYHPDNSIIMIDQNTDKFFRDFKRLAVGQTLEKTITLRWS